MHRALVLTICALAFAPVSAPAQSPSSPTAPVPPPAASPPAVKNSVDCPPGVNEQSAPSLDGTTGSGQTLSRQLSESRGVICPPAGVDPGIVETPPGSGTLRVIPPPGGEPGVQPK